MLSHKEVFQELFDEFVAEHNREPEPDEIHNRWIDYYAGWVDHLVEESKYE